MKASTTAILILGGAALAAYAITSSSNAALAQASRRSTGESLGGLVGSLTGADTPGGLVSTITSTVKGWFTPSPPKIGGTTGTTRVVFAPGAFG